MSMKKPAQIGQAGTAGQSTAPSLSPAARTPKPRKRAMEYTYSDSPPEPTTRQSIFVLKQLRAHPGGLTTIELVELGVADPRPRVRDLRELGHRIRTIQADSHTVGRYVLMSGKAVAA